MPDEKEKEKKEAKPKGDAKPKAEAKGKEGKKGKGKDAPAAVQQVGEAEPPNRVPRLKEHWEKKVLPDLMKRFGYSNRMQAPKLTKIVVNMGVGDAIQEPRYLEKAMAELAVITGQKPAFRRAKKSISNFKLREGLKIGAQVTLRGDRMYEFMDRLFNMAMPRIRDFRGVPRKSFDKFGNYTLGLKEQTIFPELNMDTVERVRGMNITFVIKNAKTKDEGFDVLDQLGMPFQRQN